MYYLCMIRNFFIRITNYFLYNMNNKQQKIIQLSPKLKLLLHYTIKIITK